MALISVSNQPVTTKADKKSQFNNRLRLIAEKIKGIKSKEMLIDNYTLWRIFCDYLVIRAYSNYYTVHTNGNIEHYEVKKQNYSEVKFECADLEFIANLLEHK